jgi:hypothetical protein
MYTYDFSVSAILLRVLTFCMALKKYKNIHYLTASVHLRQFCDLEVHASAAKIRYITICVIKYL